MRYKIIIFNCLALCWIVNPTQAAEISGSWKIIDTGGGAPLICNFLQLGADFNGACDLPGATGPINGTVERQTVRWRWQWVTYGRHTAGRFDFVGTLCADDTMTGTVEGPAISFSSKFTAKKQSPQNVGTQQNVTSCNDVSANAPNTQHAPQSMYYIPPSRSSWGGIRWLGGDHATAPDKYVPPSGNMAGYTITQLGIPVNGNDSAKPVSSMISVPLQKEGGTFVVPAIINNAINISFVIDSGASDVSIPADIVFELFRTGSVQASDFIGQKTYELADGSTMPSSTFRLRSLKVGDKIVENVIASMAPVKASPLLGQSFLGRFKSWSLDNARQALVLQ